MSARGTTPGPWVVHPRAAYVIPAAHIARPLGGAEDAAYDLATYAQEICALHHPDRNRPEAEVFANARLIASAPALYDALERALEMLEGYERDATGETFNDHQINAALAAARSETGDE